MAVGLWPYPVVVQMEVESGSATATACAWLDEGKAWTKQVTTREYSNDYTETVTDTLSGEILTNGEGECGEPSQDTEYEPPLGEQTVAEWLAAAGDLDSTVITYEDEISAASIQSAAAAAIQWSGTPATFELEFSGCDDWLQAGLSPTSVVAEHQADSGPGVCEISTARVRLTRLGASMAHIPLAASWTGGGSGSASLTGAGTTSGWFSPDSGSAIASLLFQIGPYA